MKDPVWWTRAQVRQLVQLKGADNLDGITQMAVAAYKQFDDIEELLRAVVNPQFQERHERYREAIAKADANSRLSYGIMLWWKRQDVRTLIESQKRAGTEVGANTYMMVAAYKQFDDIDAMLTLHANHEEIGERHQRYKEAIQRGEARDTRRESQEGSTQNP